MKSIASLPLFVRAVLAFTLMLAINVVAQHLFPHHAGMLTAGAPLLLGQIRQVGKTYGLLRSMSKPVDSSEPESVPHVLFDTQTYAQAGSASLTFFNNATAANASDPTLSNFATGQLDAGYFFELHRVHVIINAVPAVGAAATIAGPANDIELLHKTARATLGFRIKGKTYGDFPLAYFGRPGGPTATIAAYGTAAAENYQFASTEANGGFPYLGNLILTPATQAKGVMTFNSTAISAATPITVCLFGVLHRPLT